VAGLSPAAQEVANLQIKEADAHQHTDEAEERAAALVERVCKNDVKAERVRKEQDDLL
jgi:heterodisulfide reductase subunit A-like polyferredoxin